MFVFSFKSHARRPKTDPPGEDASWGMESRAALFPPATCPLSSKSPASFQ